jgi:hypothetical protein
MNDREYFESWLSDSIAQARALSREDGSNHYVLAEVTRWRASAEQLLVQLLGKNNPYYERFVEIIKRNRGGYYEDVDSCVAIIEAVQGDLQGGRLRSFRRMVEAEVFADFIGMAEHILDNGYYGAAAALMGGALERGLRDIAQSRDVRLGASGDLAGLNARLAQAGAYNAVRQKEVQYFIDIRNKAAHGHFDQFSRDDAKKLTEGVRELLATYGP